MVGLFILFQFLMVQLKELGNETDCDLIVISIPYGSIKSFAAVVVFFGAKGFQFLMVQLKV